MLDLVVVPATVSADVCVVKPSVDSIIHWAVVAWVHVSGEGLGVTRAQEPAVVGSHPPVLRLTPV